MRKMASDSVTEAQNAADFDKILTNAGSGLVLVHFQANWAPQCKQMNEVLTELAKDPHLVHCKFVKIEAESVPELSEKYEVAAVPTFIFLKGKGVLDRLDGANAPELTKKVKHHATPTAVVPPMPRPPKEDLDTRLKKLITQAPAVLFIKGTPDQPRCGFSKQIVQILAEHSVKYNSFNILTDEEVRQGLKKFSNWPTFPQLYVNGELLGGLDIVREMAEQGELAQHLPKEQNLDDRLKTLVKQGHVMLFMKGTPDNPRCGFSKTIISILNESGITYDTFDILQDEEVRQGLKKFSNWPTYPQLYVNGELIGGLDIVKELKESGELGQTLNAGQ